MDRFKYRNMPALWRRMLKDAEFEAFRQRQLEFEEMIGALYGNEEMEPNEEGLAEFSNVRSIYDKLQ